RSTSSTALIAIRSLPRLGRLKLRQSSGAKISTRLRRWQSAAPVTRGAPSSQRSRAGRTSANERSAGRAAATPYLAGNQALAAELRLGFLQRHIGRGQD